MSTLIKKSSMNLLLTKLDINAAKWKHANGGIILKMLNAGVVLPKELVGMNYANAKLYWEDLKELDPRMRAGIMGNMYVESKMNPNAQNKLYKGLTLLSRDDRYPKLVKIYGATPTSEINYIRDWARGTINKKYPQSLTYGSRLYVASHRSNYTPSDSADLFRHWYEGTKHSTYSRRAAAEAIYKLFNVLKEEPKLVALPISQLNLPPIVTLPDVTAITKPVLPILLNR